MGGEECSSGSSGIFEGYSPLGMMKPLRVLRGGFFFGDCCFLGRPKAGQPPWGPQARAAWGLFQ